MLQGLALETRMKVTPQMVVANNLLRLSSPDLIPFLEREASENPAIEIQETGKRLAAPFRSAGREQGTETPVTSMDSRNRHRSDVFRDRDDDDSIEGIAAGESGLDQVLAQMRLTLRDGDLEIATYLIGCLDKHGYLCFSSDQLAEELGVPPSQVERILKALQDLDPPGICARDLRECLLIQCRHLAAQGVDCAIACQILENAWDDFVNRRWERVARTMRLARHAVEEAWRFVGKNLYPYPLLMLPDASPSRDALGEADLVVRRKPVGDKSEFVLEIPGAEAFEVRVSPMFHRALESATGARLPLSSQQREWLNESIGQARMLVAAIHQRWMTLRRIGEFLIEYQRDFFERGPRHLKHLTRAQLAQALGMHDSTVSRAVADKVLQLPNKRLIPLSSLFESSLGASEAVRQVIEGSRESLSDREIAEHLRLQGFDLARRTITKYRHVAGIPNRPQRSRVARQAPAHFS